MRFRVAIAAPDPALAETLRAHIAVDAPRGITVSTVVHGTCCETLDRLGAEAADVIVLVLAPASRDVSNLVGALRAMCPRSRVVLYAPDPTGIDGGSLERGVYFYVGGLGPATVARAVHAALAATQMEEASA